MRRTVLVVLVLFLSSAAKADVTERVVAVVDDRPIFLSELRDRAAPHLGGIASSAPSPFAQRQAIEQLYETVLGRMVEERLFEQAARRLEVTVSATEIERAIDQVLQTSGLTRHQLWAAIDAQGLTPARYREELRRQLLRMKVIQLRARVNITEDQVRARYRALHGRRVRYHVAQLPVPVDPQATATEVEVARMRAQALHARITVDNFEAEMARAGGGDLGWVSPGDLPPALDDAIRNLPPGRISEPVRGPSGFHILLVRGLRSPPSYAAIRTAIWREMMNEAMAEQEPIIVAELRRRAVIDVRL